MTETRPMSRSSMSRSARTDLAISLMLIAAAIALPFLVDSRYILG
ncbi:branched-chain amino acid ABC transporter permease, partial [Mesorhizobium sp. M7A.T.Ca.TU.009.01.1.1]